MPEAIAMFREDHDTMRGLLDELEMTTDEAVTDPRSEQFAAQAKVLKNFVQQHAKEEEGEMFPRARKLIDSGELMRPGEALTGAKESAAAGVLDRPMGFVRS
jgi:hemerythrin-like domain-containing protein